MDVYAQADLLAYHQTAEHDSVGGLEKIFGGK